MKLKFEEGADIKGIYPNGLTIKEKAGDLGFKLELNKNGGISEEQFDNILSENEQGQQVFFVLIEPAGQKALMNVRKNPDPIGQEAISQLQSEAAYWTQIENGKLVNFNKPPQNGNHIICEVMEDFKTGSFFIKKPAVRAVIDGKILNGRAIFSYTNEYGEVVYLFANKGKMLTSWGGKVDERDIYSQFHKNPIVNAAKRETEEELDIGDLGMLIEKASITVPTRPQSAVEVNGKIINTETVIFHLGQIDSAELSKILPTKAGNNEGINGIVHVKHSEIMSSKGSVDATALFGKTLKEVVQLKLGSPIPEWVTSRMSDVSFEGGLLTQGAKQAIENVFDATFDNTARCSLQDEANLKALEDARMNHNKSEEKKDGVDGDVDEENQDDMSGEGEVSRDPVDAVDSMGEVVEDNLG